MQITSCITFAKLKKLDQHTIYQKLWFTKLFIRKDYIIVPCSRKNIMELVHMAENITKRSLGRKYIIELVPMHKNITESVPMAEKRYIIDPSGRKYYRKGPCVDKHYKIGPYGRKTLQN